MDHPRAVRDAGDLRRIRLTQLAAEVDTQISVMRAFAEQRLMPEPVLLGYDEAFDWPPLNINPGPDRGLILGNPLQANPDVQREMTARLPLFVLARAAHQGPPWLRWSYFFSHARQVVLI